MWTKADVRRPSTWLLLALSALAWLALWLWGQSPYSRFLSHHALEQAVQNLALAPLFVLSWVVMTTAMMLPTSLPLIGLFQRMIGARRGAAGLIAWLLAGYLLAWTVFGAVLYAGDWGLHRLVEAVPALAERAWTLSALTLLAAGLYQFTPLKYHCLDKCRSPLSFIAGHWQGRHPGREALRLGLHHGLFCVGCCWSLMLVMFAVGAGSLGWMLALGAVMAAEKNAPWGRRLALPLGVVLLLAGAGLLAAGAPAHHH
ncbi:MAG: DUF2182 domain-containing protein [Anaerolineales bacterium]|nr:DUF2182 domain-containing protein [Anaerolineales bacterium]